MLAADVRFGSKADIAASPTNVRFTPNSGHWLSVSGCPLWAKGGHQTTLFDDLVGTAKKRQGDINSQCFGGFKIDDQLNLR